MFKYLKKLFYILPANKRSFLLIVLLFVLVSGLEVIGIGVVGPFLGLASDPSSIHESNFLSRLFEQSNVSSENQFLAFLGLPVIVVFCLKSFVAWLTQSYIARFGDHQQQLLIVKMVHEYLEAPYIYHTKKNSSSVVDSIIEVANAFTAGVLNPLLTSISNTLVITALLLLLFYTSGTVMLALLVILLPVFMIFNSFKGRLREWGKQTRKSKESIIQVINHGFGSIKETKVLGCELHFEKQVRDQAKRFEQAHSNFVTFKIMPRFVMEAVMVSCIVAIVSGYLALNFATDDLTSVLGIYALASVRLLPAVSNLLGSISTLRNSSYTVHQIYLELLELEAMKADARQDLRYLDIPSMSSKSDYYKRDQKMNFQHKIHLSGISYRYPGSSNDAISDISISIDKGESIAFIGKSGAGKTTLVDLILGLLVPYGGDFKVDGYSVYKNLRAWQDLVGYIPQSIFLMDDTIERNIAFGVPDHKIDKEKMQKAIKAAQLADVVERLPDGIQTKVGERGILLSGGQRQRVGIARALYHEREILVLDEATSALDDTTEKLITHAINSLSGEKTLIIIAHRLTTVENCDQIYLMDEGRIVQSGSYQQVVLRS